MTKTTTRPHLVLMLLTLLGIGLFYPISASAQVNLVTICHQTKLIRFPWVAIRVPKILLNYHLNHGDFLYQGPQQSGPYILDREAGNWCLTNDPSILPPPPTLLKVDSSCQVDSQNALLRVENSTTDYLGFEVTTEIGGASLVNSSLTPGSELQPTFGYWVVPVARNLILQTFLLDPVTLERTALEQSTINLPSNPICTFLTYCYNGVTYSLFADGSVSYPPEGSIDGACIN